MPGGTISGNRHVLRTVTFPPITTSHIRVSVTGALGRLQPHHRSRGLRGRWHRAPGSAAGECGASTSRWPVPGPRRPPLRRQRIRRRGRDQRRPRGHQLGRGRRLAGRHAGQLPGLAAGRLRRGQDDHRGPPVQHPGQLRRAGGAQPDADVSQYGVTDFTVQYWDGTQWLAVPGGTIRGNQNVWRTVTFPALTTSRIRVW